MIIETSRLILKPLTKDDLSFYRSTDADPEVMKFLRRPAANEEELKSRFEKNYQYTQNHPGLGAFTVATKDSREKVGFGFLINIELNPENKDIEVGYRLARQHWGKGYATEIGNGLLKHGFQTLNLETIFGTTHPDHIISQKVLMKMGLKYVAEGTFYNGCKIFSIKRKAWLNG